MSSNQKQPGTGGPPSQRFATTPYQPIPSQQSRADGFHIPSQSFVQQAGNQAGSQGSLRGIQSTGPPNQSSTPPTNDLSKVQPVPQQPSLNHIFAVQASGIRGPQPAYFRPPSVGSAAAPANRMPNRQPQNQPMYTTTGAPQFMQPLGMQQMFVTQPALQNYYQNQRPPFVQHNLLYPQLYSYPSTPPQQASVTACEYQSPMLFAGNAGAMPDTSIGVSDSYYPPMSIPRPPPQPQNNSAAQNAVPQPLPTLSLPQPISSQPSYTSQHNRGRRRNKAIPIIDPVTGADKLSEMLEQEAMMSGESSSRQTPQPNQTAEEAKVVQADFAKKVAQAINTDTTVPSQEESDRNSSSHDQDQSIYNIHQAVHSSSRLESLVQSSNLKAQAKEFFLPSTATKETPIVSANCDAVEVTLPNKPPKDKESPAKSRKQSTREHKDSVKESHVNSKETIAVEKSSPNGKDEKDKDIPVVPTQSTKDKESNPVVNPSEDKKVKKENKNEPKVPVAELTENVAAAALPTAQSVPETSTANAKSKSAQKVKETQKHASQANHKPNVVVPPPQPAKPTSKSSKKSELNQKGANKEGTDMDAFADIINSDSNANIVNNSVTDTDISVNNDIVNANATVVNNNNANVVTEVVSKENNKKETQDVPVAKPDTKTLTKNNYDITSIVKDIAPPVKPFIMPAEPKDEVDRVVVNSTEKIIQTKNDLNAKSKGEPSASSQKKYDLPYAEGQWTPFNKEGKMQYTLEFLKALRELPNSNRKPESLPDFIYVNFSERALKAADSMKDNRDNNRDGGRFSMGRDFTPQFGGYAGKSNSQRGPLTKRSSQSGKMSGGGGKGSKQGQVVTKTISLSHDVKLHESENAWKPSFKTSDHATDEELKTQELFKKLRGILNKLTPEKFETLCHQVRSLNIDTEDRLKGVINLLFEKAVDEPNYSAAYARLCGEIGLLTVPTSRSTPDKPELVSFRKLLVTRCQKEFEKNGGEESSDSEKIKIMQEEIDACDDPERKKEMIFNLEEFERKMRMKSVGNIRFIGELYKKSMLTAKIMRRCLDILIKNGDEESLECMCKLMTTVGKELEEKHNVKLNDLFDTMEDIVNSRKDGTLSSRVRFMLQDVIDLKRNRWVSRRQEQAPKTIDQIQKEHETEQLNSQLNTMIAPRKEDRSSNSGHDRKQRRNVSDDGWTTTTGRSNRTQQFTVQSDKLKTKPPQIDEPLGSSQLFGSWGRGSNIKTTPASQPTNTANMYAALENVESDKRQYGAKGVREPYTSKGPSLERGYKPSYEGRGSHSRSSEGASPAPHRSASASASVPSTSRPMIAMPTPPAAAPAPAAPAKLTEEQIERRTLNNLEEFVSDNLKIEEYEQDTRSYIPTDYYPQVVYWSFSRGFEKNSTYRIKTGYLFAYLVKEKIFSLNDFYNGFDLVILERGEFELDLPRFWEYIAECLVHLVCEEVLPLSMIHKCLKTNDVIQSNKGPKFLAPLFKLVIEIKGPNFLQNIWQISGLTFEDFMKESEVENFINSNNFGFLVGGEAPQGVSFEQIQIKLQEFLSTKASFDEIDSWISANVGERVKENKFIKVLATAIFENSVVKSKLDVGCLQGHYKLLQKYIDNNSTYELQCLYALQALIHRLEHPQGLLLNICNQLYEDGTLSQESFIAWENSNDPAEQEGKGVAQKQLVAFLTQLKENEDDESSSDEA